MAVKFVARAKMRCRAFRLTLDQTRWDTLSAYSMHTHHSLARALDTAFLQGTWTPDDLGRRAHQLMGPRWRWIRPLAARVVNDSFDTPRPRQVEVAAFIRQDSGFLRACRTHELCVERWPTGPAVMRPIEVAASWASSNDLHR